MFMEKLQSQISQYCDTHSIMGVLRITIGGEIKYAQSMGFANVRNKTPFTKDSMFNLYSLTKPFCAIGLLKLKEKGLVDLDSHPSRYVPEAKAFDARVTMRHLLHHISGLSDFELTEGFAERYAPGYAKDIRRHLALLAEYPSFFAPGTDSKYSNINFVLSALTIENISGMSYAQYMKEEVFVPLGMKTAIVADEKTVVANRVTGYELENGELVEVDATHEWMFGAGDIMATVEDVYCLNKAIKNRLLLHEDTWQAVLTPSGVNHMGMGCTISKWHGKRRITHNGGSTGFRTLHIQLPQDDFDMIFLSNSGFGNARKDIAEMIHAAFYGEARGANEAVEMDKGYI